ncbi:unnamed protein product, partial [Tilletia caries]
SSSRLNIALLVLNASRPTRGPGPRPYHNAFKLNTGGS